MSDPASRPVRANALAAAVPFAFAALGLLMAFHASLLSGLSKMHADRIDTRFVNYGLEYGHRWLASRGALELWSPPFFHPQENVAAYSDVLVGALPFYTPWRLLGFPPDTSFQLWTFTVSLLDFAAFYMLLRRPLRLGRLASSLGAFLFAFGSVRAVDIGHPQLLPHFFTVAAVFAGLRLFGEERPSRERRVAWVAVFFAGVVLQLYTSFYLAWFFVFAIAICASWALLLPAWRQRFLKTVRENALPLLGAAVLAAAAAAPMALHYLRAKAAVGYRGFEDARPMLIPIKAWLYQGDQSWIYGRMSGWPVFQMPVEWEKRVGMGVLTSALVVWGFARERNRRFVPLVALGALTLVALCTEMPLRSELSPWRVVSHFVPGARAIRAVARVVLVLLIPASIGLALAIERLARGGRRWALGVLSVVVVLEQGRNVSFFDKAEARRDVAAIASAIPAGCAAFYYGQPGADSGRVYEAHVSAMWAQLSSGVPTVNGYSGNLPPRYGTLNDNGIWRPGDRERLRTALDGWMALHGRPGRDVCIVEAR